MPTLTRDGLRLSYSDTGSAPPFVFQHGLGGDAAQPASQARAGRRLITLECRGHGASPLGPEAALGFDTFARDLDALLDELRLGRVAIGGISMGAGGALALARLRPERVRALVIVRPAWLDRRRPPNPPPLRRGRALLRRYGPVAGKERFLAGARELPPALASSLASQFDRGRAREHVAVVLERLPADRPPAASGLSLPALVVGARDDAAHPFDYAVGLQRRLPGAVLAEVPPKDRGDAAHRAAVVAAIAAFLR